jgi:hypothetical protein
MRKFGAAPIWPSDNACCSLSAVITIRSSARNVFSIALGDAPPFLTGPLIESDVRRQRTRLF